MRTTAGSFPLLALLAACSGDNPATPASPSPAPPPTTLAATLADLSASAKSPEEGQRISCRDDVHAEVSLTNRAASGVLVTGVKKANGIVSGGCMSVPDYTYRVLPRVVGPNSTSVVLSQSLYTGGSGCCNTPRCSGTCEIEEVFEVVTEIGSVSAGSFRYVIEFGGCVECGAASSSATRPCPPAQPAAASIRSR